MIVSVAVTLCRLLDPNTNTGIMVCHEDVIYEATSLQECASSQAGVADWKTKGRYASDEWLISQIRCIPGHYLKKDEL